MAATAGIVLPSFLTSNSAGGAERSASQMSWWVIWKCQRYFAGVGVGRHEARAEQVVAGAIAAVLIDRRRAERHVDDAAPGVDGEEAPDVDAAAVLPGLAGPGVVEALARLRHRAERPHQAPVVQIPRAHVAGGAAGRVLLRRAAGDHEVLVDDRRRAQPVAAGEAAEDLGRVQVDDAVGAEGGVQFPRRRLDRIELGVARSEDDLRRRPLVTRPVLEAARRGVARRQLEGPLLLPRRRVEGDDPMVGRHEEHDVADDERRAFTRGEPASRGYLGARLRTAGRRRAARGGSGRGRALRPHVVHPRHLQPRRRRRRQLGQGREPLPAGIVAVGRPPGGRRRRAIAGP